MIIFIVLTAIVLLALALVIAVARETGPSPGEVAVAYERAVDRHDAETLWALAGPAPRAGLSRRAFIDATRLSFAGTPRDVIADVVVEDEFTGTVDASVLTSVRLRDGTSLTRRTRCIKQLGAWRVQSVTARTDDDDPHRDDSEPPPSESDSRPS